MITPADLDWWLDLAPNLAWRRAVTMPDCPHSYVVRDRTLIGPAFYRAAAVIRTFGEPGKFYRQTKIYLTSGDRRWWVSPNASGLDTVINMASADVEYGEQDAVHTATDTFTIYDALATEYDDRYTSAECLSENERVKRLIVAHLGAVAPSTLDVGCGTGLLLDLGITSPRVYTGVDPSQGMLNQLAVKHPDAKHLHPVTIEEALGDALIQPRYDLVVALFGAASYVEPGALLALTDVADQMLVLMHYEPGYLPDYWPDEPEVIAPSHEAADYIVDRLGGRRTKIGRFDVTVLEG